MTEKRSQKSIATDIRECFDRFEKINSRGTDPFFLFGIVQYLFLILENAFFIFFLIENFIILDEPTFVIQNDFKNLIQQIFNKSTGNFSFY